VLSFTAPIVVHGRGRSGDDGRWLASQKSRGRLEIMSLLDVEIARLDGTPSTLGTITGAQPALVVNVASRCGLTPQYATLEKLHETYADRGFTVVGIPCNQFGGQEPGTSDEIAEFCSATYGVTFPMTEKVDVNGPGRHPAYDILTVIPDGEGKAGDVQWNFEKFLVAADGTVLRRYRPQTVPDDPDLIADVEKCLTD
jgi:glutathione peroxidase